tara:strand:+ start:178 stop:981 length:804 start_codon:yes stop_codon:yes gene_type:complete
MKIKKNGKVINLTEGDLQRIVKRVLNEQETEEKGVKQGQTPANVKHIEKDAKGKELLFVLPAVEYKGKKFPSGEYLYIAGQRISRKSDSGKNQNLKNNLVKLKFQPSPEHTNVQGALNNFIAAVENAGFNVNEVIPSLNSIKKYYFSTEHNPDLAWYMNYNRGGERESVDVDGYEAQFKPTVYYDGITKKPKFRNVGRVNIITPRGDKYFVMAKGGGSLNKRDISNIKRFKIYKVYGNKNVDISTEYTNFIPKDDLMKVMGSVGNSL